MRTLRYFKTGLWVRFRRNKAYTRRTSSELFAGNSKATSPHLSRLQLHVNFDWRVEAS